MLYSILIAHYNNWEYFQKTYDSILKQTYTNYEIVILDDCSTNSNDFQKLKDLAQTDAKIKLYKNETNQGVGFTKAKLIELAKGEVVGFLDPDDALFEDALELSIQVFKSNPKVVATYSKIMMCDDGLNPKFIYPRSKKIKNGNKYFFNINNEVSHFFSFRKQVYHQTIGIDVSLRFSEDFDLYLKLYEKGDFYFINQPLYYYRQNQKSLSNDINKETYRKSAWDSVLYQACKRRGITEIRKEKISENIDLSKLIFEMENTLLKKIKRKFL